MGKGAIWREQDYFCRIFLSFFPFLHPLCPPFVCAEEDGNDGWLDVPLRVTHTFPCCSWDVGLAETAPYCPQTQSCLEHSLFLLPTR